MGAKLVDVMSHDYDIWINPNIPNIITKDPVSSNRQAKFQNLTKPEWKSLMFYSQLEFQGATRLKF